MAERDVGSARRRRERRLHSWLRHERVTVRMELAAALHHSSFQGAGPETYDASRSQMTANSLEDSVYFDLFDEDTPKGLGLTASLASGRRRGTSGTPWSRLSTPRSSFRRLMFLCRRWITNWWRSSKCPRSHLHPVIAGAVCASLSRRQNSWWKCQRSSLFFSVAADCGAEPRYSSSWSWRAKRRSSRFSSQTEFYSAACLSGTQF